MSKRIARKFNLEMQESVKDDDAGTSHVFGSRLET
jgi:hypothetical protein